MTYKCLGLSDNPFKFTSSLETNNMLWIGLAPIKESIEQTIKTSIKTYPSRLILNWGSYGSGKTYASLFFSKSNRLKELSIDVDCQPAKSIKIVLPKTSDAIVQAFLQSFLGQYSLEEIHKDFQELKKVIGKNKLLLLIKNFSDDIIMENIFKSIVNDDNKFNQLKKYIYEDNKSLLSSKKLPYGLVDDEQVVKFLSIIINCVTYEKQYYSGFFIWLDEFSDIDILNISMANRFTVFLRQFIDQTKNNLTFFVNFTQKPYTNINELSSYLGEALESKINEKIYFDNPTIDQAIQYIKECCLIFSTKKESYPFDNDEIIQYIIENIGDLTIRKIRETFAIIFEMAILNEKENIDKKFIDYIQDDIIAWCK